MKKHTFSLAVGMLVQTICQAQIRDGIKYDFSCMRVDPYVTAADWGHSVDETLVNLFGAPVSVADEMEAGRAYYDSYASQATFLTDDIRYLELVMIQTLLEAQIANPRGFTYQMVLVDDPELINAFTVGGYIFFTTAMYDFCKTQDEIACIIGHEMAHNELGHIRKNLSKAIANQQLFGDFGEITMALGSSITSGFNQHDEEHSDFVGMDYAYAAGFEVCQNVGLWKRMAELEGNAPAMMGLFRTHPYSISRSSCAASHLSVNYGLKCPN